MESKFPTRGKDFSTPPVTFLMSYIFTSSAILISWRGRGSLP